MSEIGWIDGLFVEGDALSLRTSNTSFLRGYGVFEYFRTYQRIPFRLPERIERLRRAASTLSIPLKQTDNAIIEAVEALIRKSPWKELTIRLLASGGDAELGLLPQSKATLFILAEEHHPKQHDFRGGMDAITTTYSRQLAHIKTTQYITAILALKKAKEIGAKEAFYLDSQGGILEGTTCNFFGVRDGKIYTSNSTDVLFGITRKAVLEIALGHYQVHYENFPEKEINTLDEAFTTSSIKQIVPILSINGIPLGSRQVGPITKEITQLFDELVLQETVNEATLRI